jgi:hypothetical protein
MYNLFLGGADIMHCIKLHRWMPNENRFVTEVSNGIFSRRSDALQYVDTGQVHDYAFGRPYPQYQLQK